MVRKLVLFGLGRAGHAGQLLVQPKVVLQRDRRERLVFFADRDVLLGLDRLVQSLGVAAPVEDAAGELVDDQHFAVFDDVLDIVVVERLGAQSLSEMVDEAAVDVLVEVVDIERLFDLGDARLGDRHGALFLVDLVVLARLEAGHDPSENRGRCWRPSRARPR